MESGPTHPEVPRPRRGRFTALCEEAHGANLITEDTAARLLHIDLETFDQEFVREQDEGLYPTM